MNTLEMLLDKINLSNHVEHYRLERASLAELFTNNTFDMFWPSLYGLTPAEIDIMKNAVSGGYYNWPRDLDLKDMSTNNRISKVTALYHIRKAEKKVMEKIFTRHIG